jgi:hypothetical protein
LAVLVRSVIAIARDQFLPPAPGETTGSHAGTASGPVPRKTTATQ